MSFKAIRGPVIMPRRVTLHCVQKRTANFVFTTPGKINMNENLENIAEKMLISCI